MVDGTFLHQPEPNDTTGKELTARRSRAQILPSLRRKPLSTYIPEGFFTPPPSPQARPDVSQYGDEQFGELPENANLDRNVESDPGDETGSATGRGDEDPVLPTNDAAEALIPKCEAPIP